MKLMQCPNNHYYDGDKFSTCPHCGASAQGSGTTNNTPDVGNDGVTEAFGGMKTFSSNSMPQAEAFSYSSPSAPSFGSSPKSYDDDVTVAMPVTSSGFPGQMSTWEHARGEDNMVTAPVDDYGIRSDDDEATVGIWMEVPGGKGSDTIPPLKKPVMPVVGWVVCIEGTCFGRSFELHAGRNYVGRGSDMDVCLSEDLQVSRNKHAILIFEPKSRLFYAVPGDSRSLFYINDEPVLEHMKMQARDVLQLGQTKLVFIPFCYEKFSWEDTVPQADK